MPRIPVHVFSSHPIAASEYTRLLSADPGLQVVTREARFEVVVFDSDVQAVDAVLAVARLKRPAVKPLLVATCNDEETCLRWVMRGVWGLVTYDDYQRELAPAVHQLAAGQLWFPAHFVTKWMQLTIRHQAPVCGARVTDREREVLDLLARDMSNKEIATELKISERTVKFHVANILTKLNVRSRHEVVAVTSNKDAVLPASADIRCPLFPDRICPVRAAARAEAGEASPDRA